MAFLFNNLCSEMVRPIRNRKTLLEFLLLLLLRKKRALLDHMPKQICRNSILTNNNYLMEVLNGTDSVCYELFRMRKNVFIYLCDRLKSSHLLEDSRWVSVQEKVAIFVLAIGHSHRNRVLQDRFQHSGETISRHFNDVLLALAKLSTDLIKPHTPLTEIPIHIRDKPKYYPYFKVNSLQLLMYSKFCNFCCQIHNKSHCIFCSHRIVWVL